MNKYVVHTAETIDRNSWQIYVEQHQDGSIFHTPYIHDALGDTHQFTPFAYFAVSLAGEIQAMLSGYVQTVRDGALKHLTTRAVLPASPIFDSVDALEPLIARCKSELPGKPIYTEIRNSLVQSEYRSIFEAKGFAWEGHCNIILELPEDENELWKQVGRKRKDGINKARKYSFTVYEDHTGSAVAWFYKLMNQSYKRINLPIPEMDLFTSFCQREAGSYCRIFNLKHEESVRISLFAFLFKNTLYAYYIGTDDDRDFINKRPVDLFYYEVMKWCIQNKVRYFDWMGAGKPDEDYGVREFKLQYGGDLIDQGRFIYINSPIRYRLARIGLKLMQKYGRVN